MADMGEYRRSALQLENLEAAVYANPRVAGAPPVTGNAGDNIARAVTTHWNEPASCHKWKCLRPVPCLGIVPLY